MQHERDAGRGRAGRAAVNQPIVLLQRGRRRALPADLDRCGRGHRHRLRPAGRADRPAADPRPAPGRRHRPRRPSSSPCRSPRCGTGSSSPTWSSTAAPGSAPAPPTRSRWRCGPAPTIYGEEAVLDEAGVIIPDEQEDEVEKFREFLDTISPDDFAGSDPPHARARIGPTQIFDSQVEVAELRHAPRPPLTGGPGAPTVQILTCDSTGGRSAAGRCRERRRAPGRQSWSGRDDPGHGAPGAATPGVPSDPEARSSTTASTPSPTR